MPLRFTTEKYQKKRQWTKRTDRGEKRPFHLETRTQESKWRSLIASRLSERWDFRPSQLFTPDTTLTSADPGGSWRHSGNPNKDSEVLLWQKQLENSCPFISCLIKSRFKTWTNFCLLHFYIHDVTWCLWWTTILQTWTLLQRSYKFNISTFTTVSRWPPMIIVTNPVTLTKC